MKVTEIGNILRQARLKKGYSIDELQQITKIQRRYLQSIEDDDFASLPGTFYVRSFIEQFALAVDVDPDPLIRAFNGEDVDLRPKPQAAPAPESVGDVTRKTVRGTHPKAKRISRVPVIIFSLLAIAIIGVVVVLTVLDRRENPVISRPNDVIINSTTESTTQESTTKSSTKESTAESTTESSTQSSSSAAPKAEFVFDGETSTAITMTLNNVTSPATLEFTGAQGDANGVSSWLGVYVNNASVYSHTLKLNETVSTALPDKAAAVTVNVGRTGYIGIKVNGQELKFNQSNLANQKRLLNLKINYSDIPTAAAGTGTSTTPSSSEADGATTNNN